MTRLVILKSHWGGLVILSEAKDLRSPHANYPANVHEPSETSHHSQVTRHLLSASNANSPLCYPIYSPGYYTLALRPVTSVLKGVR
jgi:hypothetical protein